MKGTHKSRIPKVNFTQDTIKHWYENKGTSLEVFFPIHPIGLVTFPDFWPGYQTHGTVDPSTLFPGFPTRVPHGGGHVGRYGKRPAGPEESRIPEQRFTAITPW